jgi:hypothetical protein
MIDPRTYAGLVSARGRKHASEKATTPAFWAFSVVDYGHGVASIER